MATMHMDIRSVSRSKGSSAVARAAYVSRGRLRDERRGITFDHRARGGLEHSEILLPTNVPRESADWALERGELWNRAEAAERRKDARVAREYIVSLPHELSAAKRLELAREFAQHIADRYGGAVDFAVHRAPQGGDPRNHHAHVLSTTREIGSAGLGAKTEVELPDEVRRERGLTRGGNEMRALRHHWADRVNEKLEEAGLDARIDARSAWERGSSQVPQPTLTRAMIQLERAGGISYAAERLREQHAARQQLMTEYAGSSKAAAQVTAVESPAHEPTEAGPMAHADHAKAPERELTSDERQQRALERWREYTRAREAGLEQPTRRAPELARDHGAELEF